MTALPAGGVAIKPGRRQKGAVPAQTRRFDAALFA
jgi:hypothetical protein